MGVWLEIPGPPVAKQRARKGNGGWYTPKPTRDYEEAVAWVCRAQRERFGDQPVKVSIVLSADGATVHVSPSDLAISGPGDLDNYAKSILDGMQKGGLFKNDKQVVELQVSVRPSE